MYLNSPALVTALISLLSLLTPPAHADQLEPELESYLQAEAPTQDKPESFWPVGEMIVDRTSRQALLLGCTLWAPENGHCVRFRFIEFANENNLENFRWASPHFTIRKEWTGLPPETQLRKIQGWIRNFSTPPVDSAKRAFRGIGTYLLIFASAFATNENGPYTPRMFQSLLYTATGAIFLGPLFGSSDLFGTLDPLSIPRKIGRSLVGNKITRATELSENYLIKKTKIQSRFYQTLTQKLDSYIITEDDETRSF